MRYDFIEIGTSDFDTLAHGTGVGISVEPIQLYLNNLPERTGLEKVCAALTDSSGSVDVYWVPPSEIEAHGLPDWVRGCNSVGSPHKTLINTWPDLYESIVRIDSVPCVTWSEIIRDYRVDSVDTIKVDTEGHDHIVLQEYLYVCYSSPSIRPKEIIFEWNSLSHSEALDSVVAGYIRLGYTLVEVGDNSKMILQ